MTAKSSGDDIDGARLRGCCGSAVTPACPTPT